MKLTQTQINDAIAFFQNICDIMLAKGYTANSSSGLELRDQNAQCAEATSIVVWGTDDDRKYLYLSGCFDYANPEYMQQCREEKRLAALGIKTAKEMELGKMLDMIKEVQSLAEEQGIDSDFVNPLTAMAEQLRTNILEYKRSVESGF